eukprot:TRINITY_DN6344_c0_g1_i1.p1 TRINITY_DN6344_c0_g1~~TRINITY_DN6344_c0_g1_i1.p1  ORF type:complete len:281 (+),score=68.29 TRINITY_DN6344_c0_g1_i1:96-938(+)
MAPKQQPKRQGYSAAAPSDKSRGACLGCSKPVLKAERRVRSKSREGYYHTECLAEKERAARAASAPRLECPKGHALTQWIGDDGLFCDGCLRDVPPGSSMHGCRKCDWDLCARCAAAAGRAPGGAAPTGATCQKGHPLKKFLAADSGWHCVVCDAEAALGTHMVGCNRCGLGFCEPCFEREMAEGGDDEGVYECESGCGFKGGFEEVTHHEESCLQLEASGKGLCALRAVVEAAPAEARSGLCSPLLYLPVLLQEYEAGTEAAPLPGGAARGPAAGAEGR